VKVIVRLVLKPDKFQRARYCRKPPVVEIQFTMYKNLKHKEKRSYQ